MAALDGLREEVEVMEKLSEVLDRNSPETLCRREDRHRESELQITSII